MTKDEAWAALEAEVNLNQFNDRLSTVVCDRNNAPTTSEANASDGGVPAKRHKSMWDWVDNLKESVGSNSGQGEARNEVHEYRKLSRWDKEDNPLLFWKQNSSLFPVLSSLAKFYLAIPATSANVERLFSIAGAIARARRSSLSLTTLQMILGYREYLQENNPKYATAT